MATIDTKKTETLIQSRQRLRGKMDAQIRQAVALEGIHDEMTRLVEMATAIANVAVSKAR